MIRGRCLSRSVLQCNVAGQWVIKTSWAKLASQMCLRSEKKFLSFHREITFIYNQRNHAPIQSPGLHYEIESRFLPAAAASFPRDTLISVGFDSHKNGGTLEPLHTRFSEGRIGRFHHFYVFLREFFHNIFFLSTFFPFQ